VLRLAACLALLLLTALPAAAADVASHRQGDDLFAAGEQVTVSDTGLEDLYAAGETVSVDSEVRESVHLAGRNVRVSRQVGRDVYAAGFNVDIAAPVAGDVVAGGYQVTIGAGARVGDDVLIAARNAAVRGPVTGNLRIVARDVELAAPIMGSVEIRASAIRVAEGARIDGTLEYWAPNAVELPPNVIAPERVTFHRAEQRGPAPVSIIGYIAGGVTLLIIAILLGALFVLLFRGGLVRTAALMRGHPWYTLLFGGIAASALFGSLLVLGASLIGIPLLPLILILIPFILLGGYLTTAHWLGRLVLGRSRNPAAGTGGWAAFGAMLLGILILALLGWIPLLGWVICVFATVFGLGPWFLLAFAPRPRPTAA
jgi:cytoskeletal protein CcmA (bactofilin family)